MARARKAKVRLPEVGFKGESPAAVKDGWYPTNILVFRDGKLHQLHKKTVDEKDTLFWWFPVESI